MTKPKLFSRRDAAKTLGGGALTAGIAASLVSRLDAADETTGGMKGNINHSVCKWCYKDIPLEDFCKAGKEIGLQSIELLGPDEWPVLKQHGMTCAMASGAGFGIGKGWNRVEHHEGLLESYREVIPKVAAAGLTNLICFSGNRKGLDDEEGIKNCSEGLKKLMGLAEKHKVTVVMELLNSKVNHPDYQCDKTPWGAALCEAVGSENFKLLYDIYHMQIMEGDLVATIKKYQSCIAHYHTGGVPGRNEIDDTQEINYPAVMKAILDTGYKGFVAQEFIPKREDKLASLKQGVTICDV
ncbi:MAG: TIM barrel protein [Verrucomicrobiota bacterium]